ncbi:hypothetical protein YC2023_085587 [Brassica napus]
MFHNESNEGSEYCVMCSRKKFIKLFSYKRCQKLSRNHPCHHHYFQKSTIKENQNKNS